MIFGPRPDDLSSNLNRNILYAGGGSVGSNPTMLGFGLTYGVADSTPPFFTYATGGNAGSNQAGWP